MFVSRAGRGEEEREARGKTDFCDDDWLPLVLLGAVLRTAVAFLPSAGGAGNGRGWAANHGGGTRRDRVPVQSAFVVVGITNKYPLRLPVQQLTRARSGRPLWASCAAAKQPQQQPAKSAAPQWVAAPLPSAGGLALLTKRELLPRAQFSQLQPLGR